MDMFAWILLKTNLSWIYLLASVLLFLQFFHEGKPCFSKLKCRHFFYNTSNLYILSDSYTSNNMLGTKNVRYSGIFKANKKTLLNQTYFKDCASQTFVATILVT